MATPLGRLPVWTRQSTLVFGRVQDVELAVRIECGAEHLVAAPADDQERVASEVGIDGHDVVAERPVETGRRQGDVSIVDLLVQVDVFGHHLSQGTRCPRRRRAPARSR